MNGVWLAAAMWAGSPAPRVKGDPALQDFLRDVVAAVDARDWDDVLAMCDEPHRHVQQQDMGIGQPQYVAEILGLHGPGPTVDGAGDGVTWADLETLGALKVVGKVQAPFGEQTVTVRGKVRTSDRRKLWFELMIVMTPEGYRLTGGVG